MGYSQHSQDVNDSWHPRGCPHRDFISAVTHTVFVSQASVNNIDMVFMAVLDPVPLESTVPVMGGRAFPCHSTS